MTVNPGEASCAALPTAATVPPQVALRYRRTVEPEAALPLISGLLSLAGESGIAVGQQRRRGSRAGLELDREGVGRPRGPLDPADAVEVGRGGAAGDIGRPGGVERDRPRLIGSAAADVGRGVKRGACLRQAGREGVEAARGTLELAHAVEVRRGGCADHVGRTGRVDRDPAGLVDGAAAEIGRVGERRARRVQLRDDGVSER